MLDPRLEEIKHIRNLLHTAWNAHMVPYGYDTESTPIYGKLNDIYGSLAVRGHELEGGGYYSFTQ